MYNANEKGFYGKFGGAYIPELLHNNVEELRLAYLDILGSEEFKTNFDALLKDYVGRPTPLYLAQNLSEQYQTNIYLKREDLTHTGAHKINNTIGQILVAKKLGKNHIISSEIEHKAVLDPLSEIKKQGFDITLIEPKKPS